MILSPKDRRELMQLLGELQTHLESAIESCLIPGTTDVMPEDAANVNEDRKLWGLAEEWVRRLESPRTRRRRPVPKDASPKSIEASPDGKA